MDDPAARLKAMSMADKVIGIALLIALISMFLPWYGVSCSGNLCGGGTSVTGFHSWGWAYFLFWLATAAFWTIRTFFPNSVNLPAMPLPDWQIVLAGGALMLISGLLFYTAIPSGSGGVAGFSYSYGVKWGWFVALLAAIGVGVGGFLRGQEQGSTSIASTPRSATPPPTPPPTTEG